MLSFSPQLLPFPLHPKKQSPKPAWSYWELSDVCASIREPFLGVEGGEGASSSKSPNEQGLGPPPHFVDQPCHSQPLAVGRG